MPEAAERRKLFVCAEGEVETGTSVVRNFDGLSVGGFNVDGRLYALRNVCPHRGGALCRGPVTGTTLPTSDFRYVYGREGEIVRCAWHGWEFDITSGRSLVDPTIRAKTYPIEISEGRVYIVI